MGVGQTRAVSVRIGATLALCRIASSNGVGFTHSHIVENRFIRENTSSLALAYRVTIRLRGLGGEVGSRGS